MQWVLVHQITNYYMMVLYTTLQTLDDADREDQCRVEETIGWYYKSIHSSNDRSYHQYGRYWYIGMARVPYMRNTNMHGKISANTERLVVKGCYYHYSAVSLSNKPKNLARNHR